MYQGLSNEILPLHRDLSGQTSGAQPVSYRGRVVKLTTHSI
jgi:hypothetical protein